VIMQGGNTWGMQEQIALFNKTVENYLPRQIKNPEELSKYLSRSIFVISVGSNDYLYNYLQPRYCTARRKYDMYTFGDLLMSELEKQLKVPYFVTCVGLLVETIQFDHIFESKESNIATNTILLQAFYVLLTRLSM
jgi:hypothetical protein